MENSRARSTKTRIETLQVACHYPDRTSIREQDPLKQGLKQVKGTDREYVCSIREQDPLKQGLKRKIVSANKITIEIREQDPLKQGLKLPTSH